MNASLVEHLATQEGVEQVEVHANRPLLVRDRQTILVVRAGYLDVFVVRVGDGRPEGVRHPLVQLEAGQILQGVEERQGFALLAVSGPETRLLRLSPHRLREVLGGAVPPGPGGMPPLSTVVEEAWLALGSALRREAAPGPGLAAEAGATWEDLQDFCAATLDRAVAHIVEEERAERERLARKPDLERREMAEALLGMASVLESRSPHVACGLPSDELYRACCVVGDAAGIKIRRPARTGGESKHDALLLIAQASHVQVRRITLRDGWWRQDSGPILGFGRDDSRPLALVPSKRRGYDMVEPGRPLSVAVDERVAASLGGTGYVFYRPLPDGALSLLDLVAWCARGAFRDGATILAMGFLCGLCALVTPVAMGMLTGTIIPSGLRSELLPLTLALIASALGSAMFGFVRAVASLRIEGRLDAELQAAVMMRLLTLEAPFFRQYTVGDLANRLLGVNQVRQLLTGATVSAVISAVFSSFSFALLFYYDWLLALLGTLVVGVVLVVLMVASWLQLRQQRPLQDLQGVLAGQVLQMINGIAKLRVAGAEVRAFRQWATRFARQRELGLKVRMISVHLSAFSAAWPVVCSLLIFAAVASTRYSRVDTPTFLAFNSAFGGFMTSVLSLSTVMTSLLKVGPIFSRVRPIFDALPEVMDVSPHPGVLQGHVAVKNVSFRYPGSGSLVLHDVSFEARPGEFVAVVGASGSGKSTLLRLLLGFEKPEQGTVLYDGQDLRQVDVQAVRRQVGVVLQDGLLMPGDIYHNIVGSSLFTMDDAWEAARIAGIADDIRAMPMGMHTYLAEGAGTISGGQRQRLMIARAVVGRPRLLFLDEATSALDSSIQEQVSQELEGLKATRVVIAHRLSTIRHADRIYVMSSGRVVEVGTFDQLMEQDGLFAEMSRRQLM